TTRDRGSEVTAHGRSGSATTWSARSNNAEAAPPAPAVQDHRRLSRIEAAQTAIRGDGAAAVGPYAAAGSAAEDLEERGELVAVRRRDDVAALVPDVIDVVGDVLDGGVLLLPAVP